MLRDETIRRDELVLDQPMASTVPSSPELRLYEFDSKTDLVVNAPRPGIGHAKHDKFTVLLIIGFTLSDLEMRG
jgi:hypothetical protein